MKRIVLLCALAGAAWSADLTGNWMAATPSPNNDGTVRRSYFDLKQEDGKITGTVRAGQFFYSVIESAGGPESFTLTAGMQDGGIDRRVVYDVTLTGEELHVTQRPGGRGGRGTPPAMVAHRVAAGEGAKPARIPPPALHQVRDNGLARTPPMGWNSWNKFAGRVNDEVVRGIADALAGNGMKDAGYVYINIDDTWEAERDAQGNIQTNQKFPDMKALADYVHSKGLKLGIYSSPGPTTCAGYEGSYGHEEQDARTWAAWGIDYLKYDWCGARNIYTDAEMQAVYQKMGDALSATGRPIVFSLCQYGRADVWKWGPDVGGNLWRTTYDIRDNWETMARIGFEQSDLAQWAKPGHWNDPDMLEIGNGGMSDTEYRTHMTLWSMLAAPLIAGNDVRAVPPAILEILTNKEVIAIDQDKAGKQAKRVSKSGDQEVWVRELDGGDRAVALFNRSAENASMSVNWSDVGIPKAPTKARDLWAHRDVAISGSMSVPGHGVVLLRVK